MQDREFILIVDDIPANSFLLSHILKDEGFAVRQAEDGLAALELMQSHHPNLILLDVQMPNMDGFETCLAIKSNPLLCDIPVIFITALSDPMSRVKGLSLGAVDYLLKPFDREELVARVKVHFQWYQRIRSLRQLNTHLEQHIQEQTQTLTLIQRQLVDLITFAN